jgi:hypothetical protein
VKGIPVSYWTGFSSVFCNRGADFRLTRKRFGVLLLGMIFLLPAELFIWSGIHLGELLFPAYHKIKTPLMIGIPGSGTAFLPRSLAQNRFNYLSMKTWEVLGTSRLFEESVV